MQLGGVIHREKSLAVEISDKSWAGISWENKMSRMHRAAPPTFTSGQDISMGTVCCLPLSLIVLPASFLYCLLMSANAVF